MAPSRQNNWPLLSKMGLLIVPQFFNQQLCQALIDGSSDQPAHVARVGEQSVTNERIRSTKILPMDEKVADEIGQRLDTLPPLLSQHFDLTITGRENPQFLRYRQGDFFQPHQDRHEDNRGYVAKRLITTVTFINDPSDERRGYEGGELLIYGLFTDPQLLADAVPVFPAAGTLIAFRPEMVHEVTPVLNGERFTLATWFT